MNSVERQLAGVAEWLKLLAHPIRLKIVVLLCEQSPLRVTTLQQRLELDQPQVTHHLTKMKDKGLLSRKRVGRNVYYEVRDLSIVTSTASLVKWASSAVTPIINLNSQ